ncbi:MAG: TetR/AcrR family transcriptional regulator [Gemmatimonadota bacterium]
MPGKKLPEEERREAILEAAYRVAVRETLGGLSMRAVAEEAGVSKGLLFFHFKDKGAMLLALLDWVLERAPRLDVPGDLEEGGDPSLRLLRVLEHHISGIPQRQERVEMFMDFWVLGMTVPEVQRRIRSAFDRFRGEFEPYTAPVAARFPERYDGGATEGLAAVVVSFIQGVSLQMMSDPGHFDIDRYMRALRGLVVGAPVRA